MNVLAAATEVIQDTFDLDLEVYHVDAPRVVVDVRELAKDVSRVILLDLAERLERAMLALHGVSNEASIRGDDHEVARITGKAEGMRLALSYLKEYQ